MRKNKTFKRTLSLLLCLIMVFGAVPLAGLLPGITTTEAEAATDGYYSYKVYNGKAAITEVDTSVSGSITIPSTLGGYPVTIIGEYAFKECTSLASITIPDSVTSIGWYAFYRCTSLESITIPDSVTSISEGAFSGCTSLASITIPDSVTCIGQAAFSYTAYYSDESNWENGVLYIGKHLIVADSTISGSYTIKDGTKTIADYAFYNCTSLESIKIPDSVTSIADFAFYNCTSLESVTFGENSQLTNIGNLAFRYCTSLASITIPDSVTCIGQAAFSYTAYYSDESNWENGELYIGKHLIVADSTISGSYTIKDGTKTIANIAFYGCTSLKSITIPDSVTSIGNGTFGYCTSLESITIPDSVTSIGGGAFDGCTSLSSITIPDSVTSIGEGAFYGCTSLESITIPDSVTSIGEGAFYSCTRLASITVNSNNKNYSSDEYGVLFNKDKTELIKYPAGNTRTSYTIPDSVTSIGSRAFEDCTSLASVTFGENSQLTSIADFAFYNCTSLASVTFGENSQLTSISEYAFRDCTSLESVTFGENSQLTSISEYAFDGCTNLSSITIPDSVTSIGDSAFSGCTNLESVTFGENSKLSNIGRSAFSTCISLYEINIPENVETIDGGAFSGCLNLKTITGGGSISSVGSGAFENTGYYLTEENWENGILYIAGALIRANNDVISEAVDIKQGTTCIGYYAFEKCTSLESVTIPDSVTSIDWYAFSGCTSLASVTFGENSQLTSIDWYAFSGCTSLESVTIPDSVTSIGKSAFSGCTNLSSITIPDSVTSIGSSAFRYCTSLESFTVDGNNKHYLTDEYGVLYNIDRTSLVAYPCASTMKDYSLPDTVTGSVDFSGSKNLETIYIPKGVDSVDFYDCSSLKTIKYGTSSGEWDEVNKNEIDSSVEIIFVDETIRETVVDEENDVTFEYVSNFYDGEVNLNVERELDGAAFDVISTQLDINRNEIYDITMTVDGVETQPSGKIKIKIPIPEGYDPAKTFVYHINPISGRVENMNAVYEDGYLIFETDHFSYYAIVEVNESSDETTTKPSESTEGVVKEPSKSTINYGDSIILHIDETLIPAGGYVEWTADNENFKMSISSDGTTCEITPSSSGDTNITATVYDKDGNIVSSDTQKMTSKAGLWQKIIAFFKKLFRLNKVIPEVFKGIIK